jgi:hypothetical protein
MGINLFNNYSDRQKQTLRKTRNIERKLLKVVHYLEFSSSYLKKSRKNLNKPQNKLLKAADKTGSYKLAEYSNSKIFLKPIFL